MLFEAVTLFKGIVVQTKLNSIFEYNSRSLQCDMHIADRRLLKLEEQQEDWVCFPTTAVLGVFCDVRLVGEGSLVVLLV